MVLSIPGSCMSWFLIWWLVWVALNSTYIVHTASATAAQACCWIPTCSSSKAAAGSTHRALSLSDSPAIISLFKTLSPDSGVSLPIPQNKITYATPKPHENSSEQFIWGLFQKNTENLRYQKPLYKKNQGFQNQLDKNPLCEHSIIKSKCSPSAHPQIPQKLQPIKETLMEQKHPHFLNGSLFLSLLYSVSVSLWRDLPNHNTPISSSLSRALPKHKQHENTKD